MRILIICWTFAAIGCTARSSHHGPDPGHEPDAGEAVDAGPDAGPAHAIHVEVRDALGETRNNTFVAVQDGDRPWTVLVATDGVYTASVHDERFGVATGCMSSPKYTSVTVRHQTISDGTTLVFPTCGFDVPTVNVSGAVIGVPANAVTLVDLGTRGFTYAFDDSYTIDLVSGTTDVIASFAADDRSVEPKVLRKPHVAVTADTNLPLDFAADGHSYATAPLSVTEAAVFSYTSVLVDGARYRIQENGSLSDTTYQTLPAALKQPGDIQVVEVYGQNNRTTTTYGVDGALAVSLPTALACRQPVIVDDGYLRPSTTFATDGALLPLVDYQLDYEAGSFDAPRHPHWIVTLSNAWTTGASTIDYTLPDLSAVAGFGTAFTFERDQPITAVIARQEDTVREQVAGRKSMRAEARFTISAR